MSSSIRNKIASFEQQNERIRQSSNSPKRKSSAFVASSSSSSKASQSRRSRLQQEVGKGPMAEEEPRAPEEGGLKERRRERQQQQRDRLAQTSAKRSSSATRRSLPEGKTSGRSQTSDRRSSHSQLNGERRVANSLSTETDEGDRALRASRSPREGKLAKAKRMQRMRRGGSPTPKEAVMMKESDTYFNKLLTPESHDDDEITETSVRQIIMTDEDERRKHRKPTLTRASSSSFDTEGGSTNNAPPNNSATNSFLLSRSHSSSKGTAGPSVRMEDDERTYDYGDRDDEESQESITFEQKKQMKRKAQEKTVETDTEKEVSPLMNQEDFEFLGKSLDTPVAKTTAGVVAAASIGAIVLGPVGLLIGAAAVGLGVGFLQIPEEQRTQAVMKAQESAMNASEKLTSTCAASCRDAGVAEHIPQDVTDFFSAPDVESSHSLKDENEEPNDSGPDGGTVVKAVEQGQGANQPQQMSSQETRKAASPARPGERRPAVLRHGRITPLSQIYSLDPAKQPRAWLDVMASAETTRDEKNEALEEINILAKDKSHARFLLEEGILDSLLWILSPSLEGSRKQEEATNGSHVRRAATSCTTLGKAHCAAVHTGGDLLLMSMYERGSVPEERQLAQMLYEVPHHALVTKSAEEESFALKTLTMPQAEELAKSITALAAGQRQT